MISVKQARKILDETISVLPKQKIALHEANGKVLAKDIHARLEMPPFDQSAVDGFAFFNAIQPSAVERIFTVVGEIRAGDPPLRSSRSQVACRIYTGAAVPRDTWCVVMQEKVTSSDNQVSVPAGAMSYGLNIRKQGGQYHKGELLLAQGTLLNPASVGVIASQGLTHVEVYRTPKVGILVTGNELITPGTKLKAGKVYESNSFTLSAALNEFGFQPEMVAHVIDQKKPLEKKLTTILKKCDVILITGGISVGKYDLVHDALVKSGVRELFYKVSQKPGKPLFAGKAGDKLVFGLPGNPAAVLVCFMHYVLPSLGKLSGKAFDEFSEKFPLAHNYAPKGDRDLLLRAKLADGMVHLLAGQDSDNLLSFAQADALAYLPVSKGERFAGDMVDVYPLWKRFR